MYLYICIYICIDIVILGRLVTEIKPRIIASFLFKNTSNIVSNVVLV